jgi:hypothetical protein
MPLLLPRHARQRKRRRERARSLVACVLLVCVLALMGRRRRQEGGGAAARSAAQPPLSSSGRRPCDRGVPPASIPRFCSSPTFSCDDGSLEALPASSFNDGHCDCGDGSDELGTSACAGARPGTLWFICPATTTTPPRRISRALVDDGVVDCPGGEDEWNGE